MLRKLSITVIVFAFVLGLLGIVGEASRSTPKKYAAEGQTVPAPSPPQAIPSNMLGK